MEQANKITAKVLAKGSQESVKPKQSEMEIKAMDYLFELLTLEYPFFTPKVDQDLNRKRAMWISMLRPINQERRTIALQKVLKHITAKGGPNISEFLSFCKTEEAHKDYRRLPAPEAKASVANAELDKMRARLGMNK